MTMIQAGVNPIATKQYQSIPLENQEEKRTSVSAFQLNDSVDLSLAAIQLSAKDPLVDPISDDPLPSDTPDPPD